MDWRCPLPNSTKIEAQEVIGPPSYPTLLGGWVTGKTPRANVKGAGGEENILAGGAKGEVGGGEGESRNLEDPAEFSRSHHLAMLV